MDGQPSARARLETLGLDLGDGANRARRTGARRRDAGARRDAGRALAAARSGVDEAQGHEAQGAERKDQLHLNSFLDD